MMSFLSLLFFYDGVRVYLTLDQMNGPIALGFSYVKVIHICHAHEEIKQGRTKQRN